MNVNQNLGVILLAIWLIVTGLLALLNANFPGDSFVLALLAVAAGILILLKPSSLHRSIGGILLSIWLIVSSLITLLGLTFPTQELIMGLLAIAAGVLLLLSGKRRE
jgi:hypothetical protein